MTTETVRRAFERHETYTDGDTDGEYVVETTAFDSRVAVATDAAPPVYTLTIRTPTLASAVEEEVGPHLLDGWFETLERRVEDAPGTVRGDIDPAVDVVSADGQAIVTLRFPFDQPDRAPDIVKTLAEYVEGTYVEGVVPGFTYRPPVSELLASATHGSEETQNRDGEGDRGGDPLPL